MESRKGILDGIRIVEAGGWIAGTGAGVLLGSLGAEVIKIEDPVRGDSYRGAAVQYGEIMSLNGRHIGFESANLNKKSLTLDLAREEGRQILHDLVSKSDVFHTNYPESTIDKLGLSYQTLKQHSPKLIYCRTSSFGLRGPRKAHRAYDTLAQAQSGLMWTMGDRRIDEPLGAVGAPLDQLTATLMAFGIVCALLGRERLGQSQEVNVSLLGSAVHLQTIGTNVALLRGHSLKRFSRSTSLNPMSNHYRCKDDKWIMLAEPMSDRYWAEFCHVMGLDHLADDPRFAVQLGGRSKHNKELIQILDQTFGSKTRGEWIRAFEENNAGFGYAPILTVDEAAQDADVVENRYVVDFAHALFGNVRLAGFPVEFSETPAYIRSEAPEHGQHTEEVLADVLGYDWDRITRLRDDSII
ncbi:MAG: CoA transferase [Chloroflexota bacterium]|nr:MAG: CoA transferase [Chloroflexota bacterium]